ncbi:MAG: hypothetical protein D6803_09035, partial [Anaerolineae bacterium]
MNKISGLWLVCIVGGLLVMAGCAVDEDAPRARASVSDLPPTVAPPPPDARLDSWMALYGGAGGEEMEGLLVTSDGGYLVSGSTGSYGDENGDAWLLRLDADGRPVWQKTYGGEGDEYILDLKESGDGFIAAGWTESFGAGDADFWVLRLDAQGDILWEKTYGGRRVDQAWSVDTTRDGGYIVAGGTESFGAGGADYWLLKLDAQGEIEWQKTYGGKEDDGGGGDYEEYVVRALEDRDGNFVLASESASFGPGDIAIWVLKLDPQGQILWQKAYGGEYEESLWTFTELPGGGYLLPGVTTSFSPDLSGDLWVLQIDAQGEILWQRLYGLAELWDEALTAGVTSDGGSLIGGYYEEENDWDWTLLRLDAEGQLLWSRKYEYAWDWPNAVQALEDGGFAVAGVAWPNAQELPEDLWMMRLDAEGQVGGDCGRIQPLQLTVMDTQAVPQDTDARVTETDVRPQDSHAVVTDTDAQPAYLCW